MAADTVFGKLVIVGKDGFQDLEFPIDKKSILIGRDHSCDIRIVNKEISRKHAEVYVEDNGGVFISSMGREPVSVNGSPVTSPLELATGDKIEVLLENRTRVFYFQGDEETVQIRPPPLARKPLGNVNQAQGLLHAAANKPAPAPAPPPPPPPPFGAARGVGKPAAPAPAPAPPPLPLKAAAAAPASGAAGMATALQDAIKAGVQLKKVQPAADKPAADKPAGGGAFVPNPADLLKLRAGLRKTAPADAALMGEEPASEVPAAPAVAAPADEACAQLEQASSAEQPAPPASDLDAQQGGSAGAVCTDEQPAGMDLEITAPEAAAAAGSIADATDAGRAVDDSAEAAVDAAAQPTGDAAMGEAEEHACVPGSAVRKRKSVRFHVEEHAAQMRVAGTPEGSARDATITIRLRRGDMEQIINVDDNTVALSLWGLGTMGEPLDDLPDTVVSKRSRHSTAAPSSAGKTPIRSALRELLAAASPAISGCPHGTPGAMGPAAPASTPATGAAHAADRADGPLSGLVVDPATLAAKLTEMAEQHDVTLEVPLDFFSPAAVGGAEGLRVVLTPKSQGKTPAASAAGPSPDPLPLSAAKSVPRTAGLSRLSQAGVAAGSRADGGPEQTREVELPSEVAAAAAAAQVSAMKRTQSAGRRRSLSRTPGTKIVIIEQATQTTPASVRAASSTQPASIAQAGGHTSSPRLQSTMAVRTEAVDDGEDVEQAAAQEQSDEGGSADGSLELEGMVETVPLKQYQKAVLRAKAHHAEARQLASQLRRMASKAAKLKKAASALSGALDGERAKRQELQEAMQQVVLNRAAAEVEDQLAAAAAADEVEQQQEEETEAVEGMEMDGQSDEVADAEAAPRVPKVVVLGKLTPAISTAERAGQVVVVRPSLLRTTAAEAPAPQSQVVLLPASTRNTPAPPAAKRTSTPAPSAARGRTPATAGRGAATPGAALAAMGKTPAKTGRTVGVPVLPKSMLKECPGTNGASRVVLESVALPGWLFDGEQQAPEVAEAAAVATAEEMEEPVPAPEAAPEAEEPEQRQQMQVEAADSGMQLQVDGPALVQRGGEETVADKPAGRKNVQQEHTLAAEAASNVEEAASEEGEEDEDFCHLCGQSDEGDILLLCDSCDNACHLSCCTPPLKRVPKGDWFCIECAAKQAAEAAATAAAAAAAAMPAAKRGVKRQPGTADEASAAKPASRGRRAAAPARAPSAAAKPAEEQAPAKSVRGRGSKRAADQEPAAPAESEQPSATRGSKRNRPTAAAPKASEEPAPSGRSLRGRAPASAGAAEEVSTRRGKGPAAAPKPEAAPTRGTRSRR